MATAQSYTANLPSVSVPDGSSYMGDTWFSQLGHAFGANNEKQMYENALTENNRAYEQALLKESREYDAYLRDYNAMREDTQIQRRIKDMKAAGLNPWLALQDGGLNGSSAQASPGTAASPGSGSSAKASSKDKSNSGSALAMLLLASAKIVKMLL